MLRPSSGRKSEELEDKDSASIFYLVTRLHILGKTFFYVVLHERASEIWSPKIIILVRAFSVSLKMQAFVRSLMRPTSAVRSFHTSHCALAQVPVLLCN